MKNIFYLIVCISFLSCQEHKDKDEANHLKGIEVNAQGKSANSGQPPADNPIMRALLSPDKGNLDSIDKLYVRTVNEAKDADYLDNLKQYGFILLVKHGLLDKGTRQQKRFYIDEQLNAQANFAIIADFYALLQSENLGLPVGELKKIEELFYMKNNDLIYALDWPDKKAKGEKLKELGYKHMLFRRYVGI